MRSMSGFMACNRIDFRIIHFYKRKMKSYYESDRMKHSQAKLTPSSILSRFAGVPGLRFTASRLLLIQNQFSLLRKIPHSAWNDVLFNKTAVNKTFLYGVNSATILCFLIED